MQQPGLYADSAPKHTAQHMLTLALSNDGIFEMNEKRSFLDWTSFKDLHSVCCRGHDGIQGP